jgi:exopolysaccharide biosynthesis polyprenyl glycosylphosphotransferase
MIGRESTPAEPAMSTRVLSWILVPLLEVLVAAAAFLVAAWIRTALPFRALHPGFAWARVDELLPIAIAVQGGLSLALRTSPRKFGGPRDLLCGALIALGVGTALVWSTFLLQLWDVSRAFVLLFTTVDLVAIVLLRGLVSRSVVLLRKRGSGRRTVLVVGRDVHARSLARALESDPMCRFNVVQTLCVETGASTVRQQFTTLAKNHVIDEIHIALADAADLAAAGSLFQVAAEQGLRVSLDPAFLGRAAWSVESAWVTDRALICFSNLHHDELALFAKRAFDLAVTLSLLPVALPLMAILAVVIRLSSPGPAIYRHERIGLCGREFTLLKFRTMRDEPEPEDQQTAQRFRKVSPSDPRITSVGRFLRRFSLDELPQLVNVLKGDMSLVGPRPLVRNELQMLNGVQLKRFSVPPGMTGLWQVSGRNSLTDARRVSLDVEYVDRWSLWMDMKILVKTIPAVLSGKGAR